MLPSDDDVVNGLHQTLRPELSREILSD